MRDTDSGSVIYKDFSFGGTFKEINEFISKNELDDFVQLATSFIAVEELKNQKIQSYESDLGKLKELARRLEGLPHIPEKHLFIDQTDFNCSEHIAEKAETFFADRKILLLDIDDTKAPTVLKSMIGRVLRKDKSPFSDSGKFKDAGFKDNLVWESLLNYDNVSDYDKVIFVTSDNDFKPNCIEEFRQKWGKHIVFLKTPAEILAEFENDYGNYISNREIYEYANTDYFKDFIDDLLTVVSVIQLPEGDYQVENYRIINLCSKVERAPDENNDYESILIHTEIEIDTSINQEKKTIPVKIITKLSDEDNKEIVEWNSDPMVT